jgi:hypothetical protein
VVLPSPWLAEINLSLNLNLSENAGWFVRPFLRSARAVTAATLA